MEKENRLTIKQQNELLMMVAGPMHCLSFSRKLDKLGRVVIQKDIRNALSLTGKEYFHIFFHVGAESIILKCCGLTDGQAPDSENRMGDQSIVNYVMHRTDELPGPVRDTGIYRKLDELGRISLPMEVRSIMELEEKDELIFYYQTELRIVILRHVGIVQAEDKIEVRSEDGAGDSGAKNEGVETTGEKLRCQRCGKTQEVHAFSGNLNLCPDCMGVVIEEVEKTLTQI